MTRAKLFINRERINSYPIIFLITQWVIQGFNILLRTGWVGGGGQVIGTDFITLYSAGWLYRFDVKNLYDLFAQYNIQQGLIQPADLAGVNPFISPPYVAQAYSIFTLTSLNISFLAWSFLSILLVVIACYLLCDLFPDWLKREKRVFLKLLVIVFSFLPLVVGWQVGQNHTLSLLLASAVIYFAKQKKFVLSGMLGGLLIYKPHYVVGLSIIWLVTRNYRSLFSLATVSSLWLFISILQAGLDPYIAYIEITPALLNLPFIDGFPGYLLVTPYAFLASVFPSFIASSTQTISLSISAITMVGFFIFCFYIRSRFTGRENLLYAFAFLVPLIASPYALFHDLVLLIPGFVLISDCISKEKLLYLTTFVYICGLFLPLICYVTGIAWLALIPVIVIAVLISSFQNRISTKTSGTS